MLIFQVNKGALNKVLDTIGIKNQILETFD